MNPKLCHVVNQKKIAESESEKIQYYANMIETTERKRIENIVI